MDKLNELELAVREHADFYQLFDHLLEYEGKEGELIGQHLTVVMFVHKVVQDQGYMGFEYTHGEVKSIADNIYKGYKQSGRDAYLDSLRQVKGE